MELPGLNFRPGKVIQAEVLRKFGLPVCRNFSSPSSPEFFLVVSFGRCKFRLTESSVATILQSVIGGVAGAFNVCSLGDCVFRFSVSSQAVGFHIYKLRSFECQSFKLFFNLWHGGDPNFRAKYRRWEADESAQWTTVNYGKQPSTLRAAPLAGKQLSTVHAAPLTGANSIPVPRSIHGDHVQISNSLNSARASVTNRFDPGASFQRGCFSGPFNFRNNSKGVLGPLPVFPTPGLPFGTRCLAHNHIRPNCKNGLRCSSYFRYGHGADFYQVPPRLMRLSVEHRPHNVAQTFDRPKEYSYDDWAQGDFYGVTPHILRGFPLSPNRNYPTPSSHYSLVPPLAHFGSRIS